MNIIILPKDFYRYLNCKKNICVLYKSSYDRNHNIMKYEHRNYLCLKHNELFTNYCKNVIIYVIYLK